jgi:hypothetical protein
MPACLRATLPNASVKFFYSSVARLWWQSMRGLLDIKRHVRGLESWACYVGYCPQSTAAKADARWPPLALAIMQVAMICELVSELFGGSTVLTGVTWWHTGDQDSREHDLSNALSWLTVSCWQEVEASSSTATSTATTKVDRCSQQR